jgi:hypothetical protein
MPGCGRSELEREGRDLVKRRGGVWTTSGGLRRCPAHDDRSPSLSVRVGSKRLLLHCFAGCAARDVLKAFRAAGFSLAALAEGPARDERAVAGSRSDGALRLWREARSLAGTPAERYLAHRGLAAAGGELRFCPRTPLGPARLTQYRPALVAAVRDETGPAAVHRTFLDPRRNRLAATEDPRRGLGPFGSGAVRLGGFASRIGLAEGIEAALSVSALGGLPCWATLGTERFRLVALPDAASEVMLFLNNDRGGHRAEAIAREAFGARVGAALYPRAEGSDWNDVLRERHPSASA